MPSRKRAARKRARKHDDRGRAVDAQSKALATPEDFDREAQNPPRAVRKRNTGGGTATAQSVDEAPQDSADEAASGRRNAHDAADHAMTTRSRALTLLLGHSRTLTKKEPPYKPLRSKAIGHITPPRNLIKGDPRPRAEDLEKVAPAGARCAFTKRDNGLLSIQVSHAADRATCLVDVRLLEVMLGMEHKSLNLNTRPNLMFLTAEIHSTYDRGFCVILPSLKILGILWQALTTKTVKGWSWVGGARIRRRRTHAALFIMRMSSDSRARVGTTFLSLCFTGEITRRAFNAGRNSLTAQSPAKRTIRHS